MKINNEYLINSLLKNKVHLGNSSVSESLKLFVQGVVIKEDKCVFDLFKQMNQIRKVSLLLKNLKKKKKPILFFGINQFEFDIQNKSKALSINRGIFNLCFTIPKAKREITTLINDFYYRFYDSSSGYDLSSENSSIFQEFFDFYNYIKVLDKETQVYMNGYFLDNWDEGSFSNYHYLKTLLDSFSNKGKNKNLSKSDTEVFNKLKNLKSLSEILEPSMNAPGAAVFFSQEGYDHVFKEFAKLGIPVVCIVNSNESLGNIDFPLLGDNSCLNVISFYQEIISESLRLKEDEEILNFLIKRKNAET